MVAINKQYNNHRTGATTPDGSITTYTWTDDDQLAAVTLPNGGGTITNTYNGDGMRFSRTDANGTNSFAWNGEILDAQLGAGNTVGTWYTQGMGEYGDIISARDTVAGASSLQLYDASGNVRQTTDAGANITATLSYDAFGSITDNSGPANPNVAWQGKQGYQFEQPLGLQYVRQRWYDPVTRQFISQDPLGFAGGDVNLFRYAGNNPINRNDPGGEQEYGESPYIPSPPPESFYRNELLNQAKAWASQGDLFASQLMRDFANNQFNGGNSGPAFQQFVSEIKQNSVYRSAAQAYFSKIAASYGKDGTYRLPPVNPPQGGFTAHFTPGSLALAFNYAFGIHVSDLGVALGVGHFGYSTAVMVISGFPGHLKWTIHARMIERNQYHFTGNWFDNLPPVYHAGRLLQAKYGHAPFFQTITWGDEFSGALSGH